MMFYRMGAPLGCSSCAVKEAETDYRCWEDGDVIRYELTCKSCKSKLKYGFNRRDSHGKHHS